MLGFSRAVPRPPLDVRRCASVAVLLAVAAFGLRSGSAIASVSHPAVLAVVRRPLAVFGVLEAVGAAACIALLVLIFRARRKKGSPQDDLYVPQEQQLSRWSRALALLVALAVLAVPIVLLVLAIRGYPHPSGSYAQQPASAGGPRTGSAHKPAGGFSWWLVAGMAAVGVAAIGLAVSAWRQPPAFPLEQSRTASLAGDLGAAVAAGTTALKGADDPRAAIIACYAAMERSLAGAGSPPAAADTPAEVLGRAAAAGFVRSASVFEALTSLFRRARYSEHALAETDRLAALADLAAIRADLGEQTQPVTAFRIGR